MKRPDPQRLPTGSGGEPRRALDTLLARLRLFARQAGDARAVRVVESLSERTAVLDRDRRTLLWVATATQRAAAWSGLEQCAAPFADLDKLLVSLECAVDAVATWPLHGPELELERIAVRYAAIDLAALTRHCCDAFRELASARRIEFRAAIPATLPAQVDATKVQRAVLNLVFNAFKATPVGGEVDVVLDFDGALDQATLTVVDSGAGVPPDLRDVLFARVGRADRNGCFGPAWLGFDLGASRDFVRLHGGDLRVVPQGPGDGAEFRLHVPVTAPFGAPVQGGAAPADLPARVAAVAARELDQEEQVAVAVAADDGLPRVLVIESSRLIQQLVRDALAGQWNATAALDGRAGVRLAPEVAPDLIITDLVLPDLDGADVVRLLRERAELDAVPILLLSSRRDPFEGANLLRAGVQDLMTKPFLVDELRARVANLLEGKRARDMLGELLGERESDLGRMAAEVARKQHRLEAALDELREARRVAEGASRVKSNFLRMMSHELKTPITALLMQLQIVAQESRGRVGGARLHSGLASMGRSVTRLLHIVDTMLEWARVESGRTTVALQSFSLAGVIEEAVCAVGAFAERKGISFDVDIESSMPDAESDPRLVLLIATNLLERAIQVTSSERIAVSASWGAGEYRVRVVDGVVATTEEERRALFDALGPDRDLTAAGGHGSGLGLHVVRDLARAIGGDLDYADAADPKAGIQLVFPNLGRDAENRHTQVRVRPHVHETG